MVPCKDGQLRVRELTQQALQRYLKTRDQDPGYWVKIHHLEYTDGGILDPDDVLADVVEDKDKLIAVFDEQEPLQKTESPGGNPADRQSPDAFETEVAAQLAAFKPVGGEIVVTPSALKLGTPLLVRRSSDPAPGPHADAQPSTASLSGQSLKPVVLRTLIGNSSSWEFSALFWLLWAPGTHMVHRHTCGQNIFGMNCSWKDPCHRL